MPDGLLGCDPAGEAGRPEHIDRRLARQAVQSQALTLWQAQQLLAGRTNGFKVDRYVLLELIGQGGWAASTWPATPGSTAGWR